MTASTFPAKPSFELFLNFIKTHNVEFPYKVDKYADFTSFDSSTYAEIATTIYRNTSYPHSADFTRYHVYKKGTVIASYISEEDSKNYTAPEFVIEKDMDKLAYNAEVAKYKAEISLNDEWFVYAIKASNDVLKNPKADKAYHMAYEHGHSYGYSSIANYFDDLAELITD